MFEDLGVSAYNGAGKFITTPDYLVLAGKIVSVEARHAAHIRYLCKVKNNNTQLKPWITGRYNDIANVDALYAGEDNAVQATITITGITADVSANAATESFDEPLSYGAVLAITDAFL